MEHNASRNNLVCIFFVGSEGSSQDAPFLGKDAEGIFYYSPATTEAVVKNLAPTPQLLSVGFITVR